MATWVTLKGATQWALQLDGIITRTGKQFDDNILRQRIETSLHAATTGGHMIIGKQSFYDTRPYKRLSLYMI